MNATSKAARFFGEVSAEAGAKIAADIAERRNRPTTEQANQEANRRHVMSQPVKRPDISLGETLLKDRPAGVICRCCTYLAPNGNCPGASAANLVELPFCHSACRPGTKQAADNADTTAVTCEACAEFFKARPPGDCLGQAVRLGSENVTAWPPCLKEATSRK